MKNTQRKIENKKRIQIFRNELILITRGLGFPGAARGEEPTCQCRRISEAGSIPGSGRSPEEGMAIHSSILAWRIPWTEEPAGLQSMGSQRVGHDWSNLACMHAAIKNKCQCWRPKRHWFDCWVRNIPWRRKWQPTPVFLPGESHRWRSLLGYSPWGRKESDTTEQLTHMFLIIAKMNLWYCWCCRRTWRIKILP